MKTFQICLLNFDIYKVKKKTLQKNHKTVHFVSSSAVENPRYISTALDMTKKKNDKTIFKPRLYYFSLFYTIKSKPLASKFDTITQKKTEPLLTRFQSYYLVLGTKYLFYLFEFNVFNIVSLCLSLWLSSSLTLFTLSIHRFSCFFPSSVDVVKSRLNSWNVLRLVRHSQFS